MEELIYLQDQIAWRAQRYDETEISLNLENRISKQLEEKLFNEALEKRYDILKENPYEEVEILLDVRVAQEEHSKSLKSSFSMDLLNEDSEETMFNSGSEDKEDENFYDIHLRESLRIMRDWVLWENGTIDRGIELSLFPN